MYIISHKERYATNITGMYFCWINIGKGLNEFWSRIFTTHTKPSWKFETNFPEKVK